MVTALLETVAEKLTQMEDYVCSPRGELKKQELHAAFRLLHDLEKQSK